MILAAQLSHTLVWFNDNQKGPCGMSEHFYLIITSDSGRTRRLPIHKKSFQSISVLLLLVLSGLIFSSSLTVGLHGKNRQFASEVAELRDQLRHSTQLLAKQQHDTEQLRHQMNLEIANLQIAKARQATTFSEEKETIVSSAVAELTDRSEQIKEVIDKLGLKTRKSSLARTDRGGPFVSRGESEHDDLLFTTDKYIETIRYTPLGRPVPGAVSSPYGSRQDPMNNEGALHIGVDFRAAKGEKILATGAGLVTIAKSNGNYGKFVQIDHGNGYVSSFAHLDRFLVKKGNRVERGQVIGLVGSSGRATGSHLHYEVSLNGKPINPAKLMKAAGLSLPVPRLSQKN
jgi:murein DD-endopeptidase MepM/ murein hydrolase activator NlpD